MSAAYASASTLETRLSLARAYHGTLMAQASNPDVGDNGRSVSYATLSSLISQVAADIQAYERQLAMQQLRSRGGRVYKKFSVHGG